MKGWLIVLFMGSVSITTAQNRANFYAIDSRVQTITATTPDSLSILLTAGYTNDLQKVRSIYSWIIQHIKYNIAIYKPNKAPYKFTATSWDTAAVWKSGDEMTALTVMNRRLAVCDGYAKLFKVICQYAGLEAAVIQGFGRTNGFGNRLFKTNHSWNAVKIDSTWFLLDLTWASGYINYLDEFVAQPNDFYFLTSPEDFSKDHYPENLQWSLLAQPPAYAEFKRSPFRGKNFIKYDIVNYQPASGQIEAALGDTIHFFLQLKDYKKARQICADPFFDSTSMDFSPLSIFLPPLKEQGNGIHYAYVVEPGKEWIHLRFNDDVIMRYRLVLKKTTHIAAL